MSERIEHRGKLITITIDGVSCEGSFGQTILEIARANDIYIPTMCYLTKVSPITACRMCVVDVEGVDGTVLSCQEKAVNGAVVTTNNEELYRHRQNIMKMYDVNHPLQCGVCDKSGECDLQNKTLEFSIDSQEFAVKEPARKKKKWGILGYDPSLCIMCEKCVHTCNEVIGSAALYVKPGGYKSIIDMKFSRCEQCGDCISVCPVGALVSNEFKYTANAWESKKIPATCAHCSSGCSLYYNVKNSEIADPYNKKITRVTNDFDFSYLCGAGRFGFEFENTSTGKNPQELEKAVEAIKSSDAIRFNSYITNEEAKILQTLKEKTGIKLINEDAFNYQRFLENYTKASGNSIFSANSKDIEASDAIIMIGTRISRDNPGIKYAVNIATKKQRAEFIYMHPIDALKYKNFLKYYSSVTGSSFYNGTLDDIHNSNFLISVGSFLKSDAPAVKYAFNNALTMNKGAGLYFHPMGDTHIKGFSKNIETIASNILSEEAILYFILDKFGKDLPSSITEYLSSQNETRTKTVVETIKEKVVETVTDEETGESKEVTKMVPKKVSTEVEYVYTKLLDIIGTDESLLETLEKLLEKKDTFSLIIGEDCIAHPNSQNVAKLAGLVEKYTEFKVVVIPTQTNTLGVSLLCDLDVIASGKTVGYNMKADFQLSALGDGDLDMPVMSQQEGTFVNINKTVVPTNAALSYDGYTLNDIANEILDIEVENTIDYTDTLFNKTPFDCLENHYTNDRIEHRGYNLESQTVTTRDEDVKSEFKTIKCEENEYIVYSGNPINQFNEFTAVSNQLKNDIVALYLSENLKDKLQLEDNNKVEVESNGSTITLEVRVDSDLEGDISYIPTFDKNIDTKKLFDNCRYSKANLRRV